MSNFCNLNLSMTTTIIDFFPLKALLRVHIEHVNHGLLWRKASDPMSHRSRIFHHFYFHREACKIFNGNFTKIFTVWSLSQSFFYKKEKK